jgi:hypothetical protein
VIPDSSSAGVVNDRSIAYFLLDEAVMSSLLAFAEGTPELKPYLMDRDPECAVVHFGGRPKPWDRWLLRNMKYFDLVVELLEWSERQGWFLPSMPWHFLRKNRRLCYLSALLFEFKRQVRHAFLSVLKN